MRILLPVFLLLILAGCGKSDADKRGQEKIEFLRLQDVPSAELKSMANSGNLIAKSAYGARLMLNPETRSEGIEILAELLEKDSHVPAALILAQHETDNALALKYLEAASKIKGPYADAVATEIVLRKFSNLLDVSGKSKEELDLALAKLECAANGGVQPAAFFLRKFYSAQRLPGSGGKKSAYYNPQKVHELTLKLIDIADLKYPYEYSAGLELFKGFGCDKDEKKAVKYFEMNADFFLKKNVIDDNSKTSEITTSQLCYAMKSAAALAYCYENGLGVAKNVEKAASIKSKISQAENPDYLMALAKMFVSEFGRDAEFLERAECANFYAELANKAQRDQKEFLKAQKTKITDAIKKGSRLEQGAFPTKI